MRELIIVIGWPAMAVLTFSGLVYWRCRGLKPEFRPFHPMEGGLMILAALFWQITLPLLLIMMAGNAILKAVSRAKP